VVCRMWRGWTTPANADRYDLYLKDELFPRLQHELAKLGYRGFHVLRRNEGEEIGFVTMVWFDSLAAVRSFAGENYETPVISQKARSILSRYDAKVAHYELSGSSWPGFADPENQHSSSK
jgi:hypothetical protein